MRKAQGSLEYLIIIAAVLAVAAVVIMFLTNAFGTQQSAADVAQCKVSASTCANDIELYGSAGQACLDACNTACSGISEAAVTACQAGQPESI